MGLSASQARLLTLTSRQHSIEGRAQRLQAEKLRLANESDLVYQKYINALDNTMLKTSQVNSETGAKSWIDASVNNLLRIDADENTTGNVFYVQDISSGKLYMPERFGNVYDDATSAEDFATKCDSSIIYESKDYNIDVVNAYNAALAKGYDKALLKGTDVEAERLPSESVADAIERLSKQIHDEFLDAVSIDSSLTAVAVNALGIIPGKDGNNLYNIDTYNEPLAKGFVNKMRLVQNSGYYQSKYTETERCIINSAVDLMTILNKNAPENSVVTTGLTSPIKKITTSYEIKNYTGEKNISGTNIKYTEATSLTEAELYEMVLNGGIQHIYATKTVTTEYDDGTPNQTIKDTNFDQAQDVYALTHTYTPTGGTTPVTIPISSFLSSYGCSNIGDALTKIFNRVSTSASTADDYLASKGITQQDVLNYEEYKRLANDFVHYSPNLERVPNDIVKAKYYEGIYNAIKAAGGWIPITEVKAQKGSWVSNMVKSAQVILTTWDENNKILSKTASELNLNLREITNKNEIEKAGQEYETSLTEITAKDTKYNNQLNELETERTVIKTELDSLKKIIKDNVERNFKLYG